MIYSKGWPWVGVYGGGEGGVGWLKNSKDLFRVLMQDGQAAGKFVLK